MPATPKCVYPAPDSSIDFGSIDARLAELHRIKTEHTVRKRGNGPRDGDDWGNIPLEGPFHFERESDRPDGLVMGPRLCGLNFRRFLEQTPVYVNPVSSLLGGYFTVFGGQVTRWDPENRWDHLDEFHARYNIVSGITAGQHFGIDLAIGLDLGFGGLLEKIRHCREANPDPDEGFYAGLEDIVVGIQSWIRNHIEAARRLMDIEPNPDMRHNLEEMVQINSALIVNPPATFRQACQWTAWYQMAARMYNGSGAVGRLDQYFYPYYQRDVAAGRLTDDEAILHLACLNLSDPQYYHIGGIDTDGNDATNEVSFLVLEAVRRLHIAANVSVGVHPGIDPELMGKAVRMLFREKLGIPRFFGPANIARDYARNGVPIEVARQRAQVGCHWTCLPGREYSMSDVIKVNLAKVLSAAFEDMIAAEDSTPSIGLLWQGFDAHLAKAVEVVAEGIDLHMEHMHRYAPELVLDLLCHGPVEKGTDASHGSLEYNTICVDGSALATAADSFAAVEQRVESEAKLTWDEVADALERDFEDAGRIQALLGSVPAFGRGGTRGDFWAERISQRFTEMVKVKPTLAGWTMLPGLFSWASTIPMGKVTPATPNGRHNGAPISFGANPDNGARKGGPVTPTSLSNAVARVQPGYGNAAPMQLDLDPGLVSDDEGIRAVEALIRGHFDLGGTLINANVLNSEMVRDACAHPDKYPDLVVRVTGFSAYFASLSPEFRQLVHDRIVHMAEDRMPR
jgi:pyruvate-formate lyase